MSVTQRPLQLVNDVAFAPAGARQADLSTSIEVARFVLVIGLVFLHYFGFPNGTASPFSGFDPERHQFATFVNSFVLFFFFSAVPLLSAVSGWLFFPTAETRIGQALHRRILGRFRTLLLPLVIWNLAALLAALALHAAAPGNGFLPALGFDFDAAGALDYVNAVLGLTGLPIALQFWFVRDLFVTVLCSPLLWLLLRHAPLVGAAALGLVWLSGGTLGIFIRTDVLFFFYMGALARQSGLLPQLGLRPTLMLLAAYVLLVALRAAAPAWLPAGSWTHQEQALELATRLIRPVGVLACWGLCLQIARSNWGRWVARYGGFAFFLHAAHYPLLPAVKFVLWRLVPAETDAWMLTHYAASVALTVLLVFLSAQLLFRLWPAGYSLLAGGRRLP